MNEHLSERNRLKALQTYDILDSLPESVFDDITLLASQICEVPIALISFVDEGRQWFKSRVGLDVSETPRSLAFCDHAIRQDAATGSDSLFVISNASDDSRFFDNQLVTGDPNIRYYCGAPLRAPNGEALGTLCVIDTKPRQLSERQLSSLAALSRQVMQLLEYRRTQIELQTTLLEVERSRKIAEDARAELFEREAFLKAITDSIPASIAYIGSDLRLKFANKHISQTLGKDNQHIVGSHVSELVTPEQYEQRKAVYEKALQGEAQVIKVELSDKNGDVLITKNVLTPDFNSNNEPQGFVVIAYDQTAEEKLKAQLLHASLEADTANAAKSAFLANMSHEIRSPLGAMMGFVELMRDGELPPADQKEYLEIITRNAGQVTRLIDDILDLSKVEAGKIAIEELEFNLEDLVSDFVALTRFRATANGIQFSVRTDRSVPRYMVSDPTRLRQILSNIVGNAIKFTQHGTVDLHMTMEGDALVLRVQDSGIGISEENAKRLFEAFHQADVSMTRRYGGTGLGLVLTRKLTQLMGGDFYLEKSEVGVGSVFVAKIRVKWPTEFKAYPRSKNATKNLASGLKDPTHAIAQASALSPKFLTGKNILIVDDAPDNLLLIKTLLKRLGASSETALDGAEGLAKAMAADYDLVLMDVQMPVMSGHEAIRSLREKGYDRPVIALTAHAMADERDRCLESGFTDFLSKPIDRSELSLILKRYSTKESILEG